MANKIYELSPTGITVYKGNYDAYLITKKEQLPDTKPNTAIDSEAKKEYLSQKKSQSDLRKIKARIRNLENEISELKEALNKYNGVLPLKINFFSAFHTVMKFCCSCKHYISAGV